jgi:hypothetical protein
MCIIWKATILFSMFIHTLLSFLTHWLSYGVRDINFIMIFLWLKRSLALTYSWNSLSWFSANTS